MIKPQSKKSLEFMGSKNRLLIRVVVRGGAVAPPEFGSSVNPIPTKGDRLCPPHYC